MKIQEQFRGRTAGFYIGLAGSVLSLITCMLYIAYGTVSGERNIWVIVPLLAAFILSAAQIIVDSDVLMILAPVCCAVALCVFVVDSVYTFVGYFFGLAMFGDVSMFGSIVRICAFAGASLLLLLISSYMKKWKD